MAFNFLSQLIDRSSTRVDDEDEGSPVDDIGDEVDNESDLDEGERSGVNLDLDLSSDDDDEDSLMMQETRLRLGGSGQNILNLLKLKCLLNTQVQIQMWI